MNFSMKNYLAKVRKNIKNSGWCLQVVLPEGKTPGMAYTIGLKTTFNHPDIIMVGFPPDLSHGILNVAVEAIRNKRRFAEPMLADKIAEGFLVAFRPVDTAKARDIATVATAIYGNKAFELTQLFLPDEKGRFPWDPDCEQKYADVQTFLLPEMRLPDPALTKH